MLELGADKGWLRKPEPVWVGVRHFSSCKCPCTVLLRANIEAIPRYLDVPEFFEAVYLVGLSTSLLKITEQRFARLGWRNVRLICKDVRNIPSKDGPFESYVATESGNGTNLTIAEEANFMTLSYFLSIVLDFDPVLDLLPTLLSSTGIIAVVDFYVQNNVDLGNQVYSGDKTKQHVNYSVGSFG